MVLHCAAGIGRTGTTAACLLKGLGLSTAQALKQVREAGSITLAGKALYDIVRSLPSETVTIRKTANNYVETTSGKVSYKLVGIAADGFPALPKFDEVDFFRAIQRGEIEDDATALSGRADFACPRKFRLRLVA